VVGATLRTRRADADVPFGAAFDEPEDLVRAIASIREVGVPLWHLAFLDPGMVRARGLGDGYLLFGAYPKERSPVVEEALRDAFGSHPTRARELPRVGREVLPDGAFPAGPDLSEKYARPSGGTRGGPPRDARPPV